MTIYRFTITDDFNPWFRAVEVEADNPDQARQRADHMLFARRTVGVDVHLHPEGDTP